MLARLLRSRRRAAGADASAARLARPVVSIGNISMGGRGKTPLAGLVARLLVEAGERPAILSRGYGRAVARDGVTVVSDGSTLPDGTVDLTRLADLSVSGDEPLMLATSVPGAAVLVCEQRALAGALAETSLGCTVHVLDDGFQHHVLRREIDIVLIAPEDLQARLMPFGRLREPVDALNHAHAIIVDGGDPVVLDTVREQFGEGRFVGGMVRTLGEPSSPLAPGSRVFAVAGIVAPERFFKVMAAGWTIAGTMPFKDHHPYSAADARAIAVAAAGCGAAAIVATSKDMVKLRALEPWPVPLVEVPLAVRVEPTDAFRRWLLASLASSTSA